MSKKVLPFLIIILISTIFFADPILALAIDVGNYKLLEPSFVGGLTEVTSFAEWARIVLQTVLGLIAGIAVVQLAYGGVEYVISASYGGKSDGKDRIQNALLGLFIALAAWLILFLINPDLISFPKFLQ